MIRCFMNIFAMACLRVVRARRVRAAVGVKPTVLSTTGMYYVLCTRYLVYMVHIEY